MRYTTIIDVRLEPWYKNPNTRLLYLHMVLSAGYEAQNLDFCRCSLRTLAADVRLSFAAVRHGIAVLEAASMVKRGDGGWYVRKFLQETVYRQRKTTRKTFTDQRAQSYRVNERDEAIARQRQAEEAELHRKMDEIARNRISYEEYKRRRAAGEYDDALKNEQ